MTEEWIVEKVQELKITDDCLQPLMEIRQYLNETPNLDTKVTNRLLMCPELFNCLEREAINTTINVEPIEIVCDILCICLRNVSFNSNDDLHFVLHRALTDKHTRIRALVLNAILKEVKNQYVMENDDEGGSNIISVGLLHYILLALQEEETDVGSLSFHILSVVLKHYLDEPAVKNVLLETLRKSDIIKCRLYELAVEIGKCSAAGLEKIEFILDHALSELDNDDVLVQVNILEILVSLVSLESNHGLAYLEKRQVLEVLSKRLENMENNPLDRLLIPGIMKFFGKISSVQPKKVIDEYPQVMHCIFDCLNSRDQSMLPTAFDTMVNLTYTETGIYLLEKNYAIEMKEVFESYSKHLKYLPEVLRVRALGSLSMIFSSEKEEVLIEISLILQKWYLHFTSGALNMQLLDYFCRMPIVDLRNNSLAFVRHLCRYSWGTAALKNTAGFLEFLLDRTTPMDQSAKMIKYYIIKILADSEAFDVETQNQLRIYAVEGPFIAPGVVEVAVEGNE